VGTTTEAVPETPVPPDEPPPTETQPRGPGLEVVLRAYSSPQARVSPASIEQAIRVIERRARRFGLEGAEVSARGDDRIVVYLPAGRDPGGFIEELIRPARLGMYDYEDSLVAGGPRAEPYALAKRAAQENHEGGLGAPRLYLFDRSDDHRLLAGPSATREALLASERGLADRCADESACEVLSTPAALALMRRPTDEGGGWDLLREPAFVLGRDVAGASADPGSGGDDAEVDIEFTEGGAARFHDLTRQVARRGARLGQRQRIAIALDNRIVVISNLNYERYPDGIDGRFGASISGDLTAEEADTLAGQLSSGAVPLSLEVESRRQV
jgi:preprotein translocase subunit SecD